MIGPALDDGVNPLVRMTHVCAWVICDEGSLKTFCFINFYLSRHLSSLTRAAGMERHTFVPRGVLLEKRLIENRTGNALPVH
jgi:hypothetical protein